MPQEQTFIRPTQGLKLRQNGGVMGVNLENIGGRILYMEEMNGHKNRMKEIKPVITFKAPWGKEEAPPQQKNGQKTQKSKKAAPAGGKRAAGSGPASRQRPGSARNDGSEEPVREFDIGILNDEHQQLYQDFVKMLCLLGNEDSRAILEQAYRESEEKKLLSGYTGIFPSLDNEEEEEDTDDYTAGSQTHPQAPKPSWQEDPRSQSAMTGSTAQSTNPYTPTPEPADRPMSQPSSHPASSPDG
eukprot:NODE_513_length_1331_cov_536.594384_g370_i0.p1 GENE.NODE_513_length_1331_cov_536.594384_g370_i0~~NODE_513_length_1331_cov_536.594384_g370_i0.p1  ORF type:complete len:243 (-),score=57.85 NODE_513_length_1331_cov_536.594384_g370_i0:492-1220(-)